MSRQPKQIHIFLYRKKENHFEYSVFQRADMLFCWQGISGGFENDETAEEAVRRELFEETGIKEKLPLYQLESISYLPANIFGLERQKIWGNNVVVVPMFFFAMPFDGEIVLSEEHTDMKWLPYEEAEKLVYYHDQKTALYELNEKLIRNILSE